MFAVDDGSDHLAPSGPLLRHVATLLRTAQAVGSS